MPQKLLAYSGAHGQQQYLQFQSRLPRPRAAIRARIPEFDENLAKRQGVAQHLKFALNVKLEQSSHFDPIWVGVDQSNAYFVQFWYACRFNGALRLREQYPR